MMSLKHAAVLCVAMGLWVSTAYAEEPHTRVKVEPSLGFGWSDETHQAEPSLYFRVGARADYAFTPSWSASVGLRDHSYRRDYFSNHIDRDTGALHRTRLGEHKLDAEAFGLYQLYRSPRLSAQIGAGPSFRFFINEAMPSNSGGLGLTGRAAFSLTPTVELYGNASWAYNLLFKNTELLSGAGGPLAITSYGSGIALRFPPNVRFSLGYEGEAVTLQSAYRLYHSVTFMMTLGFGGTRAAEAAIAPPESPVQPQPVIAAPVAPPKQAALRGIVLDGATRKPLANAVVAIAGRNRQLTDESGAFFFGDVAPGTLAVAAEHPGYKSANAAARIQAGEEQSVELRLTPLPKPAVQAPIAKVGEGPARIRGTVVDPKGKPVVAEVVLPSHGPKPSTAKNGEFELEVPPGEHSLDVSAKGYLTQGKRVVVRPGETVVVDFVLEAKPKKLLVVIRKDKIEIKQQVHFATNRDVILPQSAGLLDQVAAAIHENPQLTLIRVEGHTDNQGDDSYNLQLSQRRAESVVRALLERGVDPARVRGVGFGETKPIASNNTAKGKASNRRVEFMIEAQQ